MSTLQSYFFYNTTAKKKVLVGRFLLLRLRPMDKEPFSGPIDSPIHTTNTSIIAIFSVEINQTANAHRQRCYVHIKSKCDVVYARSINVLNFLIIQI
jgi:hypothetical protein